MRPARLAFLALLLRSAAAGERHPLDRWWFRPGDDPGWSAPDLDLDGWMEVTNPRRGGVGWYRAAFDRDAPREDLVLLLGWIGHGDETFVNGKRVGGKRETGPERVSAGAGDRVRPVPADVLRDGRNVIAVRVVDADGPGGLTGGLAELLSGEAAVWFRDLAARPRTGFPLCNFGIAAEAAPDGALLERVQIDPPVVGEGLRPFGALSLSFEGPGGRVRDFRMKEREVAREWPFVRARYRDPALPGVTVTVVLYAPVPTSRFGGPVPPVVVGDFELSRDDPSVEVALEARLRPEDAAAWRPLPQVAPPLEGGAFVASSQGFLGITGAPATATVDPFPAVRGRVARGAKTARLSLFLGAAAGGPAAGADIARPAREAWQRRASLREDTELLASRLPRTGDPELDDAMRWYLAASVASTKAVEGGPVLTMGPRAMAQRDSFWTSWPHVILWSGMESRMIAEVGREIRPDGKVPTEVLPHLDAGEDLDTNAWFLLRLIRAFAWIGQSQCCGREVLRKVLGWLLARDRDGDGLPEQVSHRADWRDVPGMAGRKYGPGFVFLFLAALKEEIAWERANGGDPKDLDTLYARAAATAHAPREKGGLWNGRSYVNVWKDGRVDDRVPEEQVLGILFDVVPPARHETILASLRANETPWGVRETFPYRDPSTGCTPGDSMNGAVWPWLNFVDAWARFHAGFPEDGLRVLKAAARGDLARGGDFLPHEYLDGETGRNGGAPLRGWNAAFFPAVFLGLLGVEPQPGGYRMFPGSRELDARVHLYPFTVSWDGRRSVARVAADPGGRGVAGRFTVGFPAGEGDPPAGFERVERGRRAFWARTVEPEYGAEVVVGGK